MKLTSDIVIFKDDSAMNVTLSVVTYDKLS